MGRNQTRSRLSRHIEKQSKKRLFFSIIGIAIVLILIFKLGIPLLIRFSLLVGDLKDVSESNGKKQSTLLLPPRLSPLPEATNSATINVEGIGTKNMKVEAFLNDKSYRIVFTDENGHFTIDSLKLREEQNTIKVRTKDKDDNVSGFSEEISIVYDNQPPALEVLQPTDNQTFAKDQKTTVVSGKTEDGAHVTINGFWAVVDGGGNFSYNLPLNPGENRINIEAIDRAGNKTTIEQKVNLVQ